MQTAAGNWDAFESRRPPMNSGVYQTTALAVYALKTYGPPAEKADTEKAIARAAAWLEAAKPATTQDRAFHLLGLAWSKAKPASIAAAAKALAAQQRADGGWSQLASMGSDAYATGEALYALNTAGRMAASRSGLCQGSEVSPEHAGRRRILAREVAFHLGAALFRKRIPVRSRTSGSPLPGPVGPPWRSRSQSIRGRVFPPPGRRLRPIERPGKSLTTRPRMAAHLLHHGRPWLARKLPPPRS